VTTVRARAHLEGHADVERLTRAVARELQAPVACVSLFSSDRGFQLASFGLAAPSALLFSWSFIAEIVATGHPLVVKDGQADVTASRNPAVRDGSLAAYAGMPLVSSGGHTVGTLSVMDGRPRTWTPNELERLRSLSVEVVTELERGDGASAPFDTPHLVGA
jgi:GAF domain-containing protein